MSLNDAIARRLEEMARFMELLGEDPFRCAAHARAARTIEGLTIDLASVAQAAAEGGGQGRDLAAALLELEAMRGVGPKLAAKVAEMLTTGRIVEADELQARIPAGLIELLEVSGLGPKTVRMFWQQAGVTDRAGLERIIADGSILSLPRMGEKAVAKIAAGLSLLAQSAGRLRLGPASVVAARVVERMLAIAGVERAEAAGSLRRGRETVGDLDVLVACRGEAAALAATAAFTTQPGVTAVLASGPTRASVQMLVDVPSRWDEAEMPAAAATSHATGGPTVQVDLKIIEPDRWGAALAYFTGSKDHNVLLRQRALDRGLTLSEHGLFPHEPAATEPPHRRGVKPIAAETEAQVHAALGLPYIPPELREGRGELALTATPRLVEVGDIRAELHAHTTASDGVLSIIDLARHAQRRGFHTVAVTDHSRSSTIANGLDAGRLRRHIAAVREARDAIPGITILAGSEVDILADGTLDYDDDLLAQLDVVVASPHASLSQEPATATARLLRAIRHPLVHIIGHPTGRLLLRRGGLDPAMGELLAAAKEYDVAMEINSHWMRLDLRDVHARAAIEAGGLLAINCDVHHPDDFDNLRFGVITARRAWAPPEKVINTWTAPRLHAWLKKKRP